MATKFYTVKITSTQIVDVEAESKDDAIDKASRAIGENRGTKTSVTVKTKNEKKLDSHNKLLTCKTMNCVYASPCCKIMVESLEEPAFVIIDENGVNWLEPETERWKIRQSCPFCGARLKTVLPSKMTVPIYSRYGILDDDEVKKVIEEGDDW